MNFSTNRLTGYLVLSALAFLNVACNEQVERSAEPEDSGEVYKMGKTLKIEAEKVMNDLSYF